MNPVDYKSFLEQKEMSKNGNVEKSVMVEKKGPLPVPPRKKKSSLGQPIFFGAVIFLLLISAVGIYYSYSGANKNQNNKEQAASLGRGFAGKLKPIFVDSDFSVYKEKADSWSPRKEGEIPFGTKLLTGNDSRRNIFAIPGAAHSIRADSDTKLMLDSSEETTNFRQRIKLALEEGKIWIEGGGDIFEVTIPQGLIRGDGNDFEIVLQNGDSHIYSWNGTLSFIPKKDQETVIYVDKGKMLFIDKAGNMIPPPPDLLNIGDSRTDWQNWNLLIKSENLLGANPTVPPIPKKSASEKAIDEKPVEVEKESAKAPEPVPAPVPPPRQPSEPSHKHTQMPEPNENVPPPPAHSRGGIVNIHTDSSPFHPPPPDEGSLGSSSDVPLPHDLEKIDVHSAQGKNAGTQPSQKPPEKMINVQTSGKGGGLGGPGQSSPSYVDSSKTSGRNVLDNSSRTTGTTGPPGYGLNEPPVGPSEK